MERVKIFGATAKLSTLIYCSLLIMLLEGKNMPKTTFKVLRKPILNIVDVRNTDFEEVIPSKNVGNITLSSVEKHKSSQNIQNLSLNHTGEYKFRKNSRNLENLNLDYNGENNISRMEKLTLVRTEKYNNTMTQTAITLDFMDADDITLSSINVDNLTLEDIFISIRTTKHFQHTRFPIILKTWFQFAPKQIWFVTDTASRLQQRQTNGHMIDTMCGLKHNIPDLCCKTNVGYDRFIESGKKWWCRFDDDCYVNVPRLLDILQKFDHTKDWYLGKAIREAGSHIPAEWLRNKIFYAAGGAGYCISKPLGLRMLPFFGDGKFASNCVKLWFPEDISMGYCLEHMLNATMTYVPYFHSHLEGLKFLKPEIFKDQISFSFSKIFSIWNVLRVPGFYGKYDPTRILSLHCYLYPQVKFCLR